MDDNELYVLLGELKAGMSGVKTDIQGLVLKVSELPCSNHSGQIQVLETWKKNVCEKESAEKLETFKGGLSLRNAIILIGITNVLTLLMSILARHLA